jgi:DNA-binding NtrC family response regulator
MQTQKEKGTLLVVDDEHLIRWSIRQRLGEEGFRVLEAESCETAWNIFERGVDLVLLDHRLPDGDGLDLLQRMTAADADVAVIMMTAYSNVHQAVTAMKAGAYHYATKPFDLDEIAIIVERAWKVTRLHRRMKSISANGEGDFDAIIGDSRVMKETKELLARVAESPSTTVLLTGESGTGKDLAAKKIHASSDRSEGPFLNITCSVLTPSLLESELFGHERGAFTDAKTRKKGLLEHAHTGTIFLDEIGEMEPGLQVKLLRFLEEKTFRRVGGALDLCTDTRIIAATNVDLHQAVRKRVFREDLFYRLAVLTVVMPPLREREGDVLLLVEYFIEQFKRKFHRRVTGATSAALSALEVYPWPGNVRELRNAVERAVLLCKGSQLTKADFPMLAAPPKEIIEPDLCLPHEGIDLHALERSLVQQALDRTKGNKTLAASLLGLNRDQIRYRIHKYGLLEHMPARNLG